jgi:predicted metal-dependent phosphoesterase TrpH
MHLDLHVHTTQYSPCSTMSPDELMDSVKAAGLDGVCITEHNKIWTRDDADALSKKHGLPVFRGMEVTTTGGDILVFGLEEEPEGIWSPAALKARVNAVGGVAIAAHPFRGFLTFGFGALEMTLEDAIDNPTFLHVHGLEICNGLVTEDENDLARKVVDELGLLGLGGSDAHKPEGVATCVTKFHDRIGSEQELIAAILGRNFTVHKMK